MQKDEVYFDRVRGGGKRHYNEAHMLPLVYFIKGPLMLAFANYVCKKFFINTPAAVKTFLQGEIRDL